MKTQKIFLALSALILVIAASGCLGSSQNIRGSPGAFPGLVITQFTSDYTNMDAGEKTSVEVDFQNVGEETASGITGILIRKGAFLVDPNTPQTAATDLEPPITETPSGDAFVWQLTAPDVTQGRTEDIQARIYYDYKSQGFGTINFVPRDIIREKGEEAFPIDSTVGMGPLDITIVANQPYIIRDSSVTDAVVRLTVTIDNVGEGRVESAATLLPGSCNKGLDCIDEVDVVGLGSNCIDSTTSAPLTKTYKGVRLVEGSEGKFTDIIRFQITDPTSATSCQLKVTAKYRYRIDSDVLSIQVKAIE